MHLNSEVKSRIAQNCSFYNHRNIHPGSIIFDGNQSCDNCQNYVSGICIKHVLKDIYSRIRLD